MFDPNELDAKIARSHINAEKVEEEAKALENKLCERFCKMMGGGYADACSSGTAAAFIAISALNLKKGKSIYQIYKK